MKKIDFTKTRAQIDFDGHEEVYNVAKALGNSMKFNSSVLLDIGFEELAKDIYFSDGEVEVPDKYIQPIIKVIMETNFIAAVKRSLLKTLNDGEH